VIMEHHTSPTLTAATVKSKDENLFKLFGLIDAAFASLMETDPNPSEVSTAEKSVGTMMKEWRRRQISMTLEAHVMEHHVIETNRKLKGLGDKDESFDGKLHPDSIRGDCRMACAPSFEKKHRSKANEERKINREALVAVEALLDLSAAIEKEKEAGPDNIPSHQES
jgi:hypothetical protein